MNVKAIVLTGLACGVASLTGCASMHQQSVASAQPLTVTGENLDVAYMNRVNEQARARGDVVIWINPPQKPTQAAAHE
ncbi:MAG: hypothetical protein JSR26_05690 [Proteobacteria bacterium]|nr:hypothetical protein [Pseudomonadota bacterium]